MPIVSIDLAWLNRLLGKPYPTETLRESLEQIGCDVEDVVEIGLSRCPQCGSLVENPLGQDEVKTCGFCGFESETAFKPAGKQQAMRLDLLADRPDLFDVGGLARALRGTLGIESGLPKYAVKDSGLTVKVDKSLGEKSSYRPFIACAVMTLPPVDETSLIAIMKLQENLHWGVGRDRKLSSIGVYDMATISGDIAYRTIDPDKEPFVPLGMPGKKMSGRQILESHPKGMAYAELLANHKRYPVLVDAKGQVLSMPPIINSDETKVKKGTTRVFIDVTGISQAAVTKSLDTLVSSLAEIGGTIETVTIVDADGKKRTTPDLKPRSTEIDLAEAKRWLGLPLDDKSLAESLRKMRFDVTEQGAGTREQGVGKFNVSYPAYRTDIRHMVDLFEDVAIGYGYGNIEPRLVRSMTVGTPRPEEVLSDRVRQILIGLGYSEIMSLPLTTEEHQFERLRIADARAISQKSRIRSSKRTTSCAGISSAGCSRRCARIAAGRCRSGCLRSTTWSRSMIRRKQVRPSIARWRSPRSAARAASPRRAASSTRCCASSAGKRNTKRSSIRRSCPAGPRTFFVAGKPIGVLGEVHPEVLTNFGLTYPVALAELTLARVC